MKIFILTFLLTLVSSDRFKLKSNQEVHTLLYDMEHFGEQLQIKIKKRNHCSNPIQNGDFVNVHYNGTLTDGTLFDTTQLRGEPFNFQIGTRKVIAGWEQGLLGRCQGDELTLIIPPHLGYGSSDAGIIPPNSILIFDIKVEQVTSIYRH